MTTFDATGTWSSATRARGSPGAELARSVVSGLCDGLIAAQLVGLMLWSHYVLDRANLTWDFAINYQAWFLIAHGHLLPVSTVRGGIVFLRNNGELILYVLAPLYWLFPNHLLGFLWLQDLAIAGVSATCLRLLTESLPWRTTDPARRQAIAGTARLLLVVLLVANPFVYRTATFDIHMEVFGTLFAMLTLRALLRRSRGALVWGVLTGLCGAAPLLYLVGVGLTATAVWLWRSRAAGSRARMRALRPLGLSALGLAWLLLLGALHATVGSPASGYAYLTSSGPTGTPGPGQVVLGILAHPVTAFDVVRGHAWNLWANTSPDGFVGLFTPVFFIAALALLPNNLLHSQSFSQPDFQNFVVYGAVALGSVAVVAALLRRRRSWVIGVLLAVAMILNAAGWFRAWFPSVGSFVKMSPGAAAVIGQVEAAAAPSDEVIASQGFIGVLAGRAQVQGFLGPTIVHLDASTVWFVLSYGQGIQLATEAETLEAIDTVASLRGVEAVHVDDHGVWVYRWHRPAGVTSLALGVPGAPYPIWMFPGPSVTALTSGPSAGWSVSSDGHASELVLDDDFQLHPGSYVATVRIRCSAVVQAVVWNWDSSTPQLAALKARPRRTEDLRIPFTIAGSDQPALGVLVGSGLFRYLNSAGVPLVTVEVRVDVPIGSKARAWWTTIAPARSGASKPS